LTKDLTAGLGDPYWYEWSVGLRYIIDMLEAESSVLSVTLQKSGSKGLDDVVVRFRNGNTRFIQVKHTRAEATLTFGTLVSGGDAQPLLRQMAEAWDAERAGASGVCEPCLVTNRPIGTQKASARNPAQVVRPPLDAFLAHLNAELSRAVSLADVRIPSEWNDAWIYEWMPQLEPLGDDAAKLEFLRRLKIESSDEQLDKIRLELVARLQACFAVHHDIASRFLALLDSALRTWATSVRGSVEPVTREIAYASLCLADDVPKGEHLLAPPAPFFESREHACHEVADLVASRATQVVFVAGEPGSGKTALLSSLANRREALIDVRFHAYRPITPENQLLPADAGRTATARALWSDLLLQLRDFARGRLARLNVRSMRGLSPSTTCARTCLE
jgi:hypothetical protein